MTQTYHYDVKSQPFPICEAPIYTYDASSPHVHLGVHCRAANSKGKERDSESGNDYAMMRYGVNRLARFSSLDPVGGDTSNPQSLNRSSYTLNDPQNLIDPLGLTGHNPQYFPGLDTTAFNIWMFEMFLLGSDPNIDLSITSGEVWNAEEWVS